MISLVATASLIQVHTEDDVNIFSRFPVIFALHSMHSDRADAAKMFALVDQSHDEKTKATIPIRPR